MRLVDATLIAQAKASEGRARGVAVHGNRLILHLVFRQLKMEKIDDPKFDWKSELKRCDALIAKTLAAVIDITDTDFPGYPASLFKNASKSTSLTEAVLKKLATKK